MRKSKFTVQQIIGILKLAEASIAVAEICRKGWFSDARFTSGAPTAVVSGFNRITATSCRPGGVLWLPG